MSMGFGCRDDDENRANGTHIPYVSFPKRIPQGIFVSAASRATALPNNSKSSTKPESGKIGELLEP